MRAKLWAAMVLAPGALEAQSGDQLKTILERVVTGVATAAEQNYVFPDTGRMVGEHLRKRLRDGAYASVTEPAQLADRLTADMRAVVGDRHLYVTYAPRGASPAASQGPQVVRRRPGDPLPANALAQARFENYDFQTVQRLLGNVGYIALSRLSTRGSPESYTVVDAAMSFLERTDALIIDLRNTVGGDPRMSDYLASYFFDTKPVPTLTSYTRSTDQTWERTTVPVKGKPRPDIPVFVLVGKGTASGTEDFAFILKQTGRGTLVGGQTAGAGRLTGLYPVGDGFTASISGGRTYDPRTGKEWERTGIQPDVAAGDDASLVTAHAAALERLASSASDSTTKEGMRWMRSVVLARSSPVAVAPAVLQSYAGDYVLRLVRFENGRLWYQRDSARLREELTPVTASLFALAEGFRVEFVREGDRVTAMKLITPFGLASTFPRTR